MKIWMVGRRLVTIFLLFFGPPPQKKNSPPDPPPSKSGSWNVKGGTSCSQREFRSPVVWSRWFCNTSFFFKKLIRKHPWCNKNGAQPTQKIVKTPWELWIIYSSNLAGCVIWRSLLKRSDFHPTLYLWGLETGNGASEDFLRSFGHEVFWAVQILGRFAPRESMQISKMKPYGCFLQWWYPQNIPKWSV